MHRLDELRRDAIHTARAALPTLADELSAQTLEETIKRQRDRMVEQRAQADALLAQKVETEARRHQALAVLERSREAISAWEQRWTAAVEPLPPALDQDPAAVTRWIELQGELRRELVRLRKLDDDIDQRQQRMEGLRSKITSFLAAVREREPGWSHSPGASPADACRLAIKAVEGSRRLHQRREELHKTAAQATMELERAEQAFVAAEQALQERWQAAGLPVPYTPESLHRLVDQAKQLEEVEKRRARSLVALSTRWGEQIDTCALEIETIGVSNLEARLADLRHTVEARKQALEQARNLRRDAESALERMAQQHDAPAIEQEYASAREAILDKAAEWYRLRVAEILLGEVQREASAGSQGLEEHASEYFRTLTGGAYDGLRIDHENPAAPQLLAIESTRSEKPLEELSTGTRDQIWLALRLAAAVAAAQETPYPLLLDDTLVQFDDTRTRHALELLHRVSEHVQIILFTHHDRVADLAEETIPAADLAVVTLPGVTGEMRKRAAKRGTTTLRERPALTERESDSPEPDILGLDPQDLAPERTRRRQRGAAARELAKDAILEILARSTSHLGKAEILAAASGIGIDLEPHWTQAIRELEAERRVRMYGKKKGARYAVWRD
jgi:DNA repair exonuclease SbcCD ATPase subunit